MTKMDVAGISRYLPSSVTLLTVGTKKEKDAMTASAMFVSEAPPILTVSVAKHIVSRDLIDSAGEFALNVATAAQVKLARQLGFTHGSEVDKFKRFAIRTVKASKIHSPLIRDSYANLECKVITSLSTANYVIYVAEVVAWKMNQKLLPVAWHRNKYFALNEETR